jgi:S-adenosylmethionine synthetase
MWTKKRFKIRDVVFTDICRLPLSMFISKFFATYGKISDFSTKQVEFRSGSVTKTFESGSVLDPDTDWIRIQEGKFDQQKYR